jgi:hypothetical protein
MIATEAESAFYPKWVKRNVVLAPYNGWKLCKKPLLREDLV